MSQEPSSFIQLLGGAPMTFRTPPWTSWEKLWQKSSWVYRFIHKNLGNSDGNSDISLGKSTRKSSHSIPAALSCGIRTSWQFLAIPRRYQSLGKPGWFHGEIVGRIMVKYGSLDPDVFLPWLILLRLEPDSPFLEVFVESPFFCLGFYPRTSHQPTPVFSTLLNWKRRWWWWQWWWWWWW